MCFLLQRCSSENSVGASRFTSYCIFPVPKILLFTVADKQSPSHCRYLGSQDHTTKIITPLFLSPPVRLREASGLPRAKHHGRYHITILGIVPDYVVSKSTVNLKLLLAKFLKIDPVYLFSINQVLGRLYLSKTKLTRSTDLEDL